MINFDAVDFSERRPEEVISFFWRSVYIMMLFILLIMQGPSPKSGVPNCTLYIGITFKSCVNI